MLSLIFFTYLMSVTSNNDNILLAHTHSDQNIFYFFFNSLFCNDAHHVMKQSLPGQKADF